MAIGDIAGAAAAENLPKSIFSPGQRGRTAGSGGMASGIGINSAQRVGVPAFRAAGVEQQIVKVPKNEIVVALFRSQPGAAGGVDLEEDLAIHQQGEEL